MKTDKGILDEFGQLVAQECFDTTYGGFIDLLNGNNKNPTKKNIVSFFLKLKEEEKKEINAYIQNVILSSYFNFLRIFEENEQFKIVYEEKGKQVNLVEISEMLKAEPIIENGWIERFSEELKKGKDN